MKNFLTILLPFLSIAAWSQQDSALGSVGRSHNPAYQQHTTIATLSLGFVDPYRKDFPMPKGFEYNNTSGYAMVYGKVEYGAGKNVSIGDNALNDAFVYNYSQIYSGYAGNIKRYKADRFRIFAIGAFASWHLGNKIRVKNLDPFVSVGLNLNNIRHSALPQGDSTVVSLSHSVTPSIKVGARYYISRRFSLLADLGYDKQSIFSLGCSCRFAAGKRHAE